MIRESIEPGTKVFHEMFGMGEFVKFEDKQGTFQGFAIIKFQEYPGLSLIARKKLIEVEL